MGFYIRKSVQAGPFRFNLSKGGIGVSAGGRGLRVGTGPKGHYIRAGLSGIRYQQSVPRARATPAIHSHRPAPIRPSSASGVVMRAVESADAAHMRDTGFSELLDDLNRKHRQARMATMLPPASAMAGTVACIVLSSGPSWSDIQGVVIALVLLGTAVAWATGRWLNSYRRVTVMAYDLDKSVTRAYEAMADAFATLAASGKKFRVDAGGKVDNLTTWKRNAGAAHLLKTEAIALDHRLPAIVRCNLMPPAIRTGGRTFHFLPDVVLIADRGGFGAVGYADLQVQTQPSRWIEEGNVPGDTQVVGHTWQHPNKGGGPDKRFRQNRQLPICLHDVLHLASRSGMNELMQFSRPGSARAFEATLGRLPRQQVQGSAAMALR